MSTIEDFENAPVGATATDADGNRAMNMKESEQHWVRRWIVPGEKYLSDVEMEILGYTLEPPASTTAREALDLTWELAHPVKEGQTIPAGAQYLMLSGDGLMEFAAHTDFAILAGEVPVLRTVDPLPEPDPDPEWVNAPAVIALVDGWMSGSNPQVFTRYDNEAAPSDWLYNGSEKPFRWQDLREVTPLYPKGQDT